MLECVVLLHFELGEHERAQGGALDAGVEPAHHWAVLHDRADL